jgi:hypothetical protein
MADWQDPLKEKGIPHVTVTWICPTCDEKGLVWEKHEGASECWDCGGRHTYSEHVTLDELARMLLGRG